jgi:NAD(P)-dependent dehydrogenase (short-subunit alcohol dehydrogenase family)
MILGMTTRITTPFGLESTAADVIDGVDLTGKNAIVTGASSGIGVETARALASAGASVTLAVRNTTYGDRIAGQIRDSMGDARVSVGALDLGDLSSVAAFVDSWSDTLHILVNNAGVMAVPELTMSASGHETQFATNHLGHFALAAGLRDALAAAGGARVVSVSSSGHLRSPVVFDDIDYAFRDYDPFGAYGQSKTANVLFAVEVTRRWADDGITANALMPGAIFTRLGRHIEQKVAAATMQRQHKVKSVEQGAATSVLLAASPLVDGVGGRYFEDCNEAHVVDRRGEPGTGGVAAYALDPANAERLWDVSLSMTG